MGYTRQIAKSISWMSGFRVFTRILSFVKTAVLARVLSPAQFGIFGIAALVLELLEMLVETGINIFLIQAKENIDKYIDSAWIISIFRGIFISVCIIWASPFIAAFFNTPESITILHLISIVPFIRGFINPAEVKFQKELRFHTEFWFRSAIYLFDALVTVIFVLITHSTFSLVYGLIAGALLEVILSFILVKPRPKFRLHREHLRNIFHSGKWVTAYGIFNYLAQQGDNIVVGRIMGSSALGTYKMAYTISTLPISEVTDVVSKVVFPFYTRIAIDKKRLKKAFLKSTFVVGSTTFLMSTIIFMFPKEIILILLGPKWLEAAEVLQVLAIYGFLRALSGSVSSLFLGVGKQKYVMNMTLMRCVGLAAFIYPLVMTYGMVGAGYAALLSVLIEIPVIIYYVKKVLK